MKTHVRHSWLLLLPLVLLAVVFAQNQQDFSFSHQLHQEMGIEDCATCHAPATESTSGTDDLLPSAESCQVCHGEEVVPPTNLPRITEYQEIFSHQQHAVNQNIDCATCHAGITQDSLITADHLPTMEDCYTCHAGDVKQVPEDCGLCHAPGERLTPKTHTTSWNNFHGMAVATDTQRQECTTCHVSESFCQDCHFGDNVVQQSHPMNWEYTHGIETRHRSTNCASCHENQQQFCAECHAENLVMPVTHAIPGWAAPGTGGMHAARASMDVDNCASCHTDPGADPTCLECHAR